MVCFVMKNEGVIVESIPCAGNGCGSCPDPSASCGNSVCETALGENCNTCPFDCGTCVLCAAATCGNGVCDPTESGCSCPQDCVCCLDGLCLSPETYALCPTDCAGALYGKVQDYASGSPIPGATVTCGIFLGTSAPSVTTDNSGNFVVQVGAPGLYQCVGSYQTDISAYYTFTAYPGSAAFHNVTNVIVLQQQTGLLSGLTYFKEGPVLLPRVTVVCQNANNRRETVSDSHGVFIFTGVVPGTYICEGSAAGYSPVDTTVTVSSAQAVSTSVYVDILRGNIAGSVVNSLSGLNVDSTVTCVASNQTLTQTTTGGLFYFTNVLPGPATCLATPLGSGWIPNTAAGIVPGGLNLTLNINVSQVLSNLTGTVTNAATGASIASADVSCGNSAQVNVALTNAAGAFTFTGLAAGSYTCTARRSGYNDLTTANFSVGTGTVVTAPALGLAAIPGSVVIFVTSTRTSLPISAQLTCTDVLGNTILNANVTGIVTLPSVQPGTLTCVASAPSYVMSTSSISVPAVVQVYFSVQLSLQFATVSGVVTDATVSTPIRGVIIGCGSTNLNPANFYSSTSDSNGAFSFPQVILGSYQCLASVATYNPTSLLLNFSVPQQAAVSSFTMTPLPASLSGRVVDSQLLTPLGGAAVTCTFQGLSSGPLNYTTAADGIFFFNNIMFFGPWRCAVVLSGYSVTGGRGFAPVLTQRGVSTSLQISMDPAPGTAMLEVIDASTNASLPLAQVYCGAQGVIPGRIYLNNNGEANYTNVRGSYFCTATLSPGYQPFSIPSFALSPGVLLPVVMAMTPIPGSLQVLVVNSSPSPIAGARLLCAGAPPVFSSPIGQAVVPSLPAGTASCAVSATGYQLYSFTIVIADGVRSSTTVTLVSQ